MSARLATLLLLASLPALAAEQRPARRRLLVMPTTLADGLTAATGRLLDEVMLSDLAADPRWDVIGSGEINRLLQLEAGRNKAGCDAESCLAEVAGALGADDMVMANLGRIGASYVVSLKLFRVSSARVEKRWTENFPAKEDDLVPAVHRAVAGLLPPEHPGAPASGSTAAAGEGGGNARRTGPLVAGAVAVVAALAGGVLGGLALGANRDHNASFADAAAFTGTGGRAAGLALGANVAFGAAVLAGVGGGALWVSGR